MTMRWDQVPQSEKDLVFELLRKQRQAALGACLITKAAIAARLDIRSEMMVEEAALISSKKVEDAIDAALERLGAL